MLYLNQSGAPRRTYAHGDRPDSAAVWVDLLNPTDNERDAAERLTKLRVPSRDDVSEIENSSRAFTEDGSLYLSMPYSYMGADNQSAVTAVGFVLSDSHLLTLRFVELSAFDTYAKRFADGTEHGSKEALAGLLEAIVDRQADVLERVAGQLDQISKSAFRDNLGRRRRVDAKLRGLLSQVGRAGDALGNLRDGVLGLARIAAFLDGSGGAWAEPALKQRLTVLRADIASLNDYDQQLATKVAFLLDAVLGFINIEQNDGVRVLTIASVVGIPPTFVVGLYGMNFKNMPEYDWTYGYQFGWAMILISVIIPIVWFRLKGWI